MKLNKIQQKCSEVVQSTTRSEIFASDHDVSLSTFLINKFLVYFFNNLNDYYSNSGCNDFDLEKFGLTQEQIIEVNSAINAHNKKYNPIGFEPKDLDCKYAFDFELLHVIEKIVLK